MPPYIQKFGFWFTPPSEYVPGSFSFSAIMLTINSHPHTFLDTTKPLIWYNFGKRSARNKQHSFFSCIHTMYPGFCASKYRFLVFMSRLNANKYSSYILILFLFSKFVYCPLLSYFSLTWMHERHQNGFAFTIDFSKERKKFYNLQHVSVHWLKIYESICCSDFSNYAYMNQIFSCSCRTKLY
jgi:hypothetical protein